MGSLDYSVREWYVEHFDSDELGREIKDDVMFSDVLDALEQGVDVYDVLGVGDSLVRERVFDEMSSALNVDYDVIYNLWLHGGKLKV